MKIANNEILNTTDTNRKGGHEILFDNIIFYKKNKTFTIAEGSKGTYAYTDIIHCKIVNEDAKYTGNSELFTHKVLADYFQPWGIFPKNVYVGLEFLMKNKDTLYVYVTCVKRQINTLDYHDDRRKAKEIKEVVDRIIMKYRPK